MLEDVRVAPFVDLRWAQLPAETFDRYTPNNYPCGCVALAMSEIMKFHEWPRASLPQVEAPCVTNVNVTPKESVTVTLSTMGGVYDWANMPARPLEGASDAQGAALSRICYDAGVVMNMQYGEKGSSSYAAMAYSQFTNYFRYASAQTICTGEGFDSDRDKIRRAMLANLDAGLPVLLAIEGHAVVGDGYGYSGGELFYHELCGFEAWTSYDWWALAPSVGEFTTIKAIVYNIMPEDAGELVMGRVTDSSGNPVAGATVTATIRRAGASASVVTAVTSASATGVSAVLFKGWYSNHARNKCGNSWGNDLVLLASGESAPAEQPRGWIGERAETTEATGTWSRSVEYGADGDIYVREGDGFVTIRWDACYRDSWLPVSISATLYEDWTIRLSYGVGNDSGGMVGISSGDGEEYISLGTPASLDGADDIVFNGTRSLPGWISLSADGRLSGIPPRPGTYRFTVEVTDADGEKARRELSIATGVGADMPQHYINFH